MVKGDLIPRLVDLQFHEGNPYVKELSGKSVSVGRPGSSFS